MRRIMIIAAALLVVHAGALPADECKEERPQVGSPFCVPIREAPAPTLHQPEPITGVFVEPWCFAKADWPAEVKKMHGHGIDLVIIKCIPAGKTDDQRWGSVTAIADAASALGMSVYLGLNDDPDFSVSDASVESLKKALKEDRTLADEAVKRKVPMNGWYISREIHNSSDQTAMACAHALYLQPLSDHLKAPGIKILISPQFNAAKTKHGELLGPDETGKAYAAMLDKTEVNIVALQDTMGVRNECGRMGGCAWRDRNKYLAQIAQYAEAVASHLPDKVDFWLNVEAFGPDLSKQRLVEQRSIAPKSTKRIVAFQWSTLKKIMKWD